MEYSYRKSILENEKRYYIDQDKFSIEDLKTSAMQYFSLNELKTIHLKYLAKKNMPDAFLCSITTKSGLTILLSSQHYIGIGSFENRESSYSRFVVDLHSLLQNQDIVFSKGIGIVGYWASMIFFILAGLVAAAIALAALIPYGIFILLVIIYLALRLKKHFKLNKPGTYDPLNIPKELLP